MLTVELGDASPAEAMDTSPAGGDGVPEGVAPGGGPGGSEGGFTRKGVS